MRVRALLLAGLPALLPTIAAAQDAPAAAAPQVPVPAVSQRGGSFELTLGGGVSAVNSGLNDSLSTSVVRIVNRNHGALMMGGQVRATYNASRHLGVGLGAAMTNGNGAVLITPFGALTYTLDLDRGFSPFLDVGAGLTRIAAYTGSLLGDATHRWTSSYSAFGGLGVRAMVGGSVALRLEARVSYDQFSEYGKGATNGAAFAGLSLFVGGGPPRDSDADGVPDRRDACADTPAGATVDAQGCALDSDTDGVYDGLDRCADTPAGATVDANGCPVDSAGDGVADHLDRCASTPTDARPVDANGCPVDSDGDGVPDHLDRCASTPAGVPVDASGCPLDSDNDGVTDNLDRCPDTPADARPVNPAGHAQAGCPADSDSDGVPDHLDRCPNTAAGTQVDANGCPVRRDGDGDGVTDERDRCPNTAANTRVDAAGCPLPEAPAVGAALVLRNVLFRAATAVLLPSSNAQLDALATAMLSVPGALWEIAGYTDNRGNALSNLRLSQRRASAVLRYLAGRGVPAASMRPVGYGARNPVASNATLAGRAQNRRVEVRRLE